MNNTATANSTEDFQGHQNDTILVPVRITLPVCLIAGIYICIACTSGLLNCLLLSALSRIKRYSLRSKWFIQNSVVANMLLPIIVAVDLPVISSIFEIRSLNVRQCFSGVYYTLLVVGALAHTNCSLCLICDRIYAIAAPMVYRTTGYKSWVRASMVITPWVIAAGLLIVCLAYVPLPPALNDAVCWMLYTDHGMSPSLRIMDIYLTSTMSLSFCIYITIFIVLRSKQGTIQQASDSILRRQSRSLVVSYFLMNITMLCLYLPSPVYTLLWYDRWDSVTEETIYTYDAFIRGFIALYLCNSIIDPLILLHRVPSIRDNLPFALFAGQKKERREEMVQNRKV